MLYRDIVHSKDYWTPVFEGTTDEVPTEHFSDWKQTILPDWPAEDGFTLLDVHMHPEFGQPPALSLADLDLIEDSSKGYNVRPVVTIGTVDQHRHGYLLVLQRRGNKSLSTHGSDVIEELWDRCKDAAELWPSRDYAKHIQASGYVSADVLQVYIAPKSCYAQIDDPEYLRSFRWTQ